MTKQHVLMGFMQVIHQSNVGKPLRISMGFLYLVIGCYWSCSFFAALGIFLGPGLSIGCPVACVTESAGNMLGFSVRSMRCLNSLTFTEPPGYVCIYIYKKHKDYIHVDR